MATRITTYNRLADTLRRRILDGRLQPGQQLPTEQRLCEQFGASRITVRRALQILEEELLVHRKQGSGTFVSTSPSRKIPILNTDFFGSIARHAPDLTRRVETTQWMDANEELAEQLDVVTGESLLRMVRIDELRRTPVAADELWLPQRFVNEVDVEVFALLDFLDHWQEAQGILLDYCTQTIEAISARKPWSKRLGIRSGDPLLRETNILFATAGQRAGLFVSYYRHDFFRFDATVKIRPGTRSLQEIGATNG